MIARRELLTGIAAASACAGAAAGAQPVRRTRDGAPDLQGMWTNASGTPLERPRTLKSLVISEPDARAYDLSQKGVNTPIPGDDVGQNDTEWREPDAPLARIRGEARTSIVVDPADGRLPYSPAGRKAMVRWFASMGDFRGPEVRPVAERCLIGFSSSAGAPMIYASHTSGACQFVQTREHLVIRAEDNGDLRVISFDPAAAAPSAVRPWMGVSVGRWEGDTLVVETSRFNPSETMRSIASVFYMSPEARVAERFTRTSPDTIFYAFSVDDPAVFTQVWRGESVFHASRAAMFESACHEGNYSLPNILAGARRAERDRQAAR